MNKPGAIFRLAAITALSMSAADKVDFNLDVKPILEHSCTSCHGETKAKGDIRLDTREWAFDFGDDGPSVVAGKPDESPLYTSTILPLDHDDIMPPIKHEDRDYPLTKAEQKVLYDWIEQGAEWPEGVKLTVHKRLPKKVDFVEHIKPILEQNCVSCHCEKKSKGDLRLDTRKLAFTSGENAPSIVAGQPKKSPLYTSTTLPLDHEDIMPPKNGPLDPSDIALLRRWIEEGAEWPEAVTLVPVKKVGKTGGGAMPEQIYKDLGLTAGPTADKFEAMVVPIAGTDLTIDLVPIPGGSFTIGSPAGEANRNDNEGPQRQVEVSPFWMQKTELTWNIYEMWQMDVERQRRRALNKPSEGRDVISDAISRPTPPYTDMTFSMGKNGYPAICMTHLAARTFCMWLSAKTGYFFRLPTEAEWEYACRAGTTTAYSFGDDAKQLGDYAWYAKNSDFQYQKVGLKKPNPWGLYDMHGNVAEWVLDQLVVDGYSKLEGKDPMVMPTALYPRVARGGNWDQEPEQLRSAIRMGSNESWKQQDPQIPQSVWYLTDALGVGFRLVRASVVPPLEDLPKYWPSKAELEAVPQR